MLTKAHFLGVSACSQDDFLHVIHERLEGLLHVAGQVLLARAVARGLLPADADAGPIDADLARVFAGDGQGNLPAVRAVKPPSHTFDCIGIDAISGEHNGPRSVFGNIHAFLFFFLVEMHASVETCQDAKMRLPPIASTQFLRGINTLFLSELQHAAEAYTEVFRKSPRTGLVKVTD